MGGFDDFAEFLNMILHFALLRGFVGADVEWRGGAVIEGVETKVFWGASARGGGGKGLKILRGAESGATLVAIKPKGEIFTKGGPSRVKRVVRPVRCREMPARTESLETGRGQLMQAMVWSGGRSQELSGRVWGVYTIASLVCKPESSWAQRASRAARRTESESRWALPAVIASSSLLNLLLLAFCTFWSASLVCLSMSACVSDIVVCSKDVTLSSCCFC